MTGHSEQTALDYSIRVRQLRARAEALGPISDERFVDWLIDKVLPTLSPASWRQYRSAVVADLEQNGDAESTRRLIMKLKAARATRKGRASLETSAQKLKVVPDEVWEKIKAALAQSTSAYADDLVSYIEAGRLTGLRPIEWQTTKIFRNPSSANGFVLRVENAKFSLEAGRGHSRVRHLEFGDDAAAHRRPLAKWLNRVRSLETNAAYVKFLSAIRSLMYLTTRSLFPRRKQLPTLYSTRHSAAAEWKAAYKDDSDCEAIVGTLLGHASDATARTHYARQRKKSSGMPIPKAKADEIARVRRIQAKRLESLYAAKKRFTLRV